MKDRFARVTAGAIVLIGLLAAAPLYTQTAPEVWKQYPYPSDGFAISAPSVPTYSNQVKATDAGNVEIHTYTIPLGSNGVVMISSSQVNGLEKNSPRTRLQMAKEGALKAGDATLTTEKEITVGRYPGLQYEATAQNLHVRARMYIVKNRLFQLLEISPLTTPFPIEAERISTSFKILN